MEMCVSIAWLAHSHTHSHRARRESMRIRFYDYYAPPVIGWLPHLRPPPPTLFRQAGHESMGGKGKMSPCGRDKHAQTENDRSWGLAMTAACLALFGRAFFVCFECRRIHFDSKRVESRPGVENIV